MKWMLLMLVALPAVSDAVEENRAQSVAAVFDKYCLSAPPTFSSIDRLASEAMLSVAEDRSMPLPNGQLMRQKNWRLPAAGGAATMLTSGDVVNGDVHVTGCGVYNPDVSADALEAALSALPRMGAVKRHAQAQGGAATVWWSAALGMHAPSADSEVMMSKDIPNIPGVSVNLIYKTHLPSAPGTQ